MRILFLIIAINTLTACTKDKVQTVNSPSNHAFELSLAHDWIFVGDYDDSYYGYYQKGSDIINFDFGKFGFNGVDSIKQVTNTLYYEEVVIDGCDSKIVKEQREDGIRLSAYIDKRDGVHMTWLCTYNPKDDQKFIAIFKSHKFK